MKKMSCKASAIIDMATAWIGKKESNNSHRAIIDVYNSHKPLARGYKVKYTDSWCATFVSAVAISCNATDIIPTECSCEKMIDKFKKLGIWHENENMTPKAGDIIFYDWQDSGIGDNKGWSDHVGIISKVSGNILEVIEGNLNNSVDTRTIKVNAKFIRGYGVPKYSDALDSTLKIGDVIKLKEPIYYNGKAIPSWVMTKKLYYRGPNKKGVIFSTLKTGDITGVVKPGNVIKV